jgi:hypothetical protein
MRNQPSVEHKVEKIQNIFQQALSISAAKDDLVIQEHLKKIDPEFRAVAFEGVAMGIASKDLLDGNLQQLQGPNPIRHAHAVHNFDRRFAQTTSIAEEPQYDIIPFDAYKQWLRKNGVPAVAKQNNRIRVVD